MYNIITDVHVTSGNAYDSVPNADKLNYQIDKFGFKNTIEAVALDAGYFTTPICKALHDRIVFAVIGHRAITPVKGLPAKLYLASKKCRVRQPFCA
ncbi:hypothetical protein SAMN05518846_113132 [Brevibacillus centrosporus]|uniref:Transposase DDE domain-containing protein n=1 Tax=Brevibacillus centrosporus TaxID=54910 RepID=A0A1I3ZK68_9BACL|nr:hypothetical protein SAMN05518846_113132 [Brevibacillus centrosporus]